MARARSSVLSHHSPWSVASLEEAIGIYQQKLTIVDLLGEDDKETILSRAQEAVSANLDPWPEKWEPEVPSIRLDLGATGGTGGMAGRFSPDTTGLFLIGLGPWGDTIEMEHYTHEGYLDYRIVGTSAEAMCRTLLENGLMGDFSHALYVGREAQKAEVALGLHLDYEQDRALSLSPT